MAKKHIKKNDQVIVIAGAHKGLKGNVVHVSKDKQRITIDKINIVKKHTKPTQQNPDGGIVEKEAPIHVSNVKLVLKGKAAKEEKKAKKLEQKEAKAKETKVEAKEVKAETKPKETKAEAKKEEK